MHDQHLWVFLKVQILIIVPEEIVLLFYLVWGISSPNKWLFGATSSALINHEQCQKFRRKQGKKTHNNAAICRQQEKSNSRATMHMKDSQEKRNSVALLVYGGLGIHQDHCSVTSRSPEGIKHSTIARYILTLNDWEEQLLSLREALNYFFVFSFFLFLIKTSSGYLEKAKGINWNRDSKHTFILCVVFLISSISHQNLGSICLCTQAVRTFSQNFFLLVTSFFFFFLIWKSA